MHINLHLLRVFFAVAEQRSFSRAAETLFVSQPAVSKAVRELEHQLDLPLLERGAAGAKGVRLTANGAALFDHARGIFALERAATEDIRARVGLKSGRFPVGASSGISHQRTIELGSNEGIARALACGLGSAMPPARVLRELITLGQVKALNYPSDSPLVRPLFLLQLKERPPSPLIRAFCEVLQRRLEDSR